ncbi:MAG: N-acetyltransferase [Dissulfuribacterales bacterium]
MIRKATIEDIKPIYSLLKYYGDKGVLLARPLSKLYDHVRDFLVYVEPGVDPKNKGGNKSGDKEIIGFCALQFCWEDLAEIRSLAIKEDYFGQTIGTQLVKAAFEEAQKYKIKKIFVLTYQPKFFKKFGFTQIDKSDLPIKIWADCILCVKFPDCDETAMLKEIATPQMR